MAEYQYKAILFDVYGTLFSSATGDIAAVAHNTEVNNPHQSAKICGHFLNAPALDAVAASYDPKLSGEELSIYFHQKVDEVLQRMRLNVEWPEVQADQIWAEFLQERGLSGSGQELALRYELAANPVNPMPGAEQTITRLREAGCLFGIISNAQFYTPLLFERFFGGRPENIGFDKHLLFYSFEFGVAKPSPVLFNAAARELGVRGIKTQDCAFVGNDMFTDIYGSQNAGFQAILFAGDSRTLRLHEGDERVKGVEPSRVIYDLRDLVR